MGAGIVRHPALKGAPAQLRRLQALRHEALDRPGVDEHVERLGERGALGVALGDVDALDAEIHRELGPLFAGRRLLALEAEIGGEVDQRLLDEPRHHAGIGAAARHRGGAAGVVAPRRQHGFAQSVVGARFRLHGGVEIEAGPRLDHGVDVERADFAGELHDVERGGVDREVDQEALARTCGEQRHQKVAVIVARHRLLEEAHAALVEQRAIVVAGIDDHELRAVECEMAFDQGQGAPANRAEADHHDRAIDAVINRPVGHGAVLQNVTELRAPRGRTGR